MHQESADVRSTPGFALVVVAASAGGLTALAELLNTLSAGFPLPVAVVQHLDPNHHSRLAEILARHTQLRVKEARPGDKLSPGVVYIAPPGQHMLIGTGFKVRLNAGAKVHFLRPSADRLFESAASVCGPVIGVVLTGTGSDGAAGIAAIKAAGGAVIAQDEESSAFFGMPQAAIETGLVDFVLPLSRIGSTLVELAGTN